MMYGKIAQAIAEEGLDAHPRDYLNFYCLGVREPLQPDDQVGAMPICHRLLHNGQVVGGRHGMHPYGLSVMGTSSYRGLLYIASLPQRCSRRPS
jgi:hypothetical protein